MTRVFPIVGNFSGAGFPIIGKVSNAWKTAFAGLLLFVFAVSSLQAVEYNYVGWASGGVDAQGGVLLATTNGTDWFRQGIGQIPAVDLGGVCSAGSNVWVVGDVTNGYGLIAYSADDGQSWVRQGDAASVPALTLRKPWAVDENTIWVVGDNGSVMRTVNGGTTWSNVSLPTFTNMLQGVTAVDAQTAWVSGVADSNGFAGLFYTTDGGQNWTRAVQGAITNRDHVLGLYALDADLVWGLAGEETLIRSEDGGVNWVRVSGGTLKDGNELKVLDENHIWMAVDAQVQWTINGGYSWDGHNTAEYTMDVDTPWGTNVWAVSSTYNGGIIYHSPDSGLTWTNQAESNSWRGLFMVDMQMRQGPGSVLYVDAASTNAVSPYSNWATAASNIQDAVDAAEEGDTVLVTNGVYRYGGGQLEKMPLSCARVAVSNNITVRSVNGPDVTFIEGEPGDYSDPDDIHYAYRCAAIDFGLEEALISGFTLQSGHSYSASGYMTGPVDSMAGGAAVLGGMLSNCVVKNNQAITGGGVGFISFAEQHRASISHCRIYSNTASYAGGMIAWGALTVDNCEIRYNSAMRSGDTGSGRAGGCEVLGFKTQGMEQWNVPVLRNCWIGENYADNEYRGGGGVYMTGGHLVNCTILHNQSRSAGGGLYFDGGETNISSIVNTLIYYNEGVGYANYYDAGSMLAFASCCSTPAADGLMTNEPMVAGLNNAHLLPESPLRGAGDASAVLEGAVDMDDELRLDSGQVDIGCDQVYPENMTNQLFLSYTPEFPKVVAGRPIPLSALSEGRLMNLVWSVDTNGGNYTVSNAVQIAPVWDQAGSYNVRLWATNLNGGRMIIDTVTVVDGFTNYVSPTGSHISPFTNLAEAATNIQSAVDACYAGGTVLVDDGTYDLSDLGAVQMTKPVTLAGLNGYSNVVVTLATPAEQRLLVMDHEDAVVRGITLQNGRDVKYGGGAQLYAGTLQDSCVRSNRAEMAGGGVKAQGTARIQRCRFEGNECDGEGGAVYASQNALIENSFLINNRAHGQAGEGGGGGGGAFLMDSAVLRNSFLSDNSAWTAGGVLLYSGGTLQNCTILRNQSYGMAGGVLNGMGSMYNNIIYYNTAQTYPNYYNKSDNAYYNCTVPGLEGTGNITNQPLLMGKKNPHIVAASPCFNAGSGDYVGYSETDIDGEVRTYDGRVDIGCDEYIPTNILGALTVNIEGESGTLVDDDVELFADITGRAQGYCWFVVQDNGTTQAVADTYMITPVWSVTGNYAVILVTSNLDGAVSFTQTVQVVNAGFTNYVSISGSHVSPFTSWATAATNVQAAVDACYAHGTVLVASGVYTQQNTLNIDVPVSVCGAGNDRSAVVLDGGRFGRVVSMTHTAAVLSGVTLCGGIGDHGAGIMMTAGTVSNCVITACGELENDEEAGAYVLGDSLMTHCSITSNKAVTVGGVRLSNRARLEYSEVNFNETKYDAAGLLLEHDAVAKFCEIKGNLVHMGFAGGVFFNQGGTVDYTMIHSNAASQGVGATFMKGGALSNSVIELSWGFFNAAGFWMENGGVIDNCLIQSNIAYSGNGGGGLISTYGQIKNTLFRGNTAVSAAGVKLQNGGEISDCVFQNNEARDYRDLKASAGALEFLNDGSVDRCQFIGNHSDRDGGAVHMESGGVIRNSLFAGNTAGTKGGGAYLCVNPNALQQSAYLYCCTFAGNTAGEEGGGVWLDDKGEVYNSILYGNSAGTNAQYGVDEYNSEAKMNNTCAAPLWFREGTNNIIADPVFANSATGNYRLTSGSPCVNSGDRIWVSSYLDLVNDPRLIGTNVDMGCYEYTLAPDGFSATVDDRTVNLAWNGVTGAQGYNVYRSRTPDSHCKLVASLGAGVTNWQDTGRCSGSIYYFVRAAYGGEDGEATETKQVRLTTVYLDFDGDGKADITVYWPEQGLWYILQSSNQTERVQSWGWADAQPVPGDYDGDGKVDVAVYNAQAGSWLILESSTMILREQAWGGPDFEPVAADYDGDGKTDIAVFDAAVGGWHILQSSDSSHTSYNWGWSETVPVTGDYDGDGKADCAVYWADGGQWYIRQSATETGRTQPWGWSAAEACQGDFDGDGKTDVGVYSPEDGWWNVLQSGSGEILTRHWGWSAALPVAADYDGDGRFDVSVYAPTAGMWYIWQNQSQTQRLQPWGWSDALPVNK